MIVDANKIFSPTYSLQFNHRSIMPTYAFECIFEHQHQIRSSNTNLLPSLVTFTPCDILCLSHSRWWRDSQTLRLRWRKCEPHKSDAKRRQQRPSRRRAAAHCFRISLSSAKSDRPRATPLPGVRLFNFSCCRRCCCAAITRTSLSIAVKGALLETKRQTTTMGGVSRGKAGALSTAPTIIGWLRAYTGAVSPSDARLDGS